MRANEELPQTGAHRLPNAEAMPPQVFARPVIGSIFLLVFGSILSIVSFAGAKATAEKKSHDGRAGASNSTSAFRLEKGICTPGVLMPSFWAAGCVFSRVDAVGLSAATR